MTTEITAQKLNELVLDQRSVLLDSVFHALSEAALSGLTRKVFDKGFLSEHDNPNKGYVIEELTKRGFKVNDLLGAVQVDWAISPVTF